MKRECKFVTHLEAIPDVRPDVHLVKEYVTYDNGVRKPAFRIIPNLTTLPEI